MRNTIRLLAFLVLGYSNSYAQEVAHENKHNEIKEASLTNKASKPDKPNDLKTQLVVYSLIILIYTLYGFKQKT